VNSHDEINLLLRAGAGLLVRRDHPHLAGSLDWLVREWRLAAVLPGLYAIPEITSSWHARAKALALRHRDAVLLGAAAARISYRLEAQLDDIEAAIPYLVKPQPGFKFNRRHIAAELITERDGLRYSIPALTAVDLATFVCSDAIDVALRVRAATLRGMHDALRMTPHRAGNKERLKLLIDSRDEPWSAAERLSHRLLRTAGIRGWKPTCRRMWTVRRTTSTSHSSNRRWRSRLMDACMKPT
jgi:hypothetical protein